MNILIVVAHPKKQSLSFAIAKRYKELHSSCDVEILDLYTNEHQQPFFTYDDSNEIEPTVQMRYYQQKIAKADELVFVFPYWWGSFPAILKNFFDWNLSRGFAFEYQNSRPVGLLGGKSVKIFVTTGAPKFLYTITGASWRLKAMFKSQIVAFCGMRLESFKLFGGVGRKGTDTDKILKAIA